MPDYSVSEWTEYIPEWDGNRDRFLGGQTEDIIAVEVKLMTTKESEGMARQIVTTVRPGFRGQSTDNSVEVGRKQFMKAIRNIQNVRVNGENVATPEALWDGPLGELVSELNSVMNSFNSITEGEAKNLKSQSDGASGTKKAKTG